MERAEFEQLFKQTAYYDSAAVVAIEANVPPAELLRACLSIRNDTYKFGSYFVINGKADTGFSLMSAYMKGTLRNLAAEWAGLNPDGKVASDLYDLCSASTSAELTAKAMIDAGQDPAGAQAVIMDDCPLPIVDVLFYINANVDGSVVAHAYSSLMEIIGAAGGDLPQY